MHATIGTEAALSGLAVRPEVAGHNRLKGKIRNPEEGVTNGAVLGVVCCRKAI